MYWREVLFGFLICVLFHNVVGQVNYFEIFGNKTTPKQGKSILSLLTSPFKKGSTTTTTIAPEETEESEIKTRSDDCVALGGTVGECIFLEQCDVYLDILQRNPPYRVKQQLRQTLCGYGRRGEVRVCCPVKFYTNSQNDPVIFEDEDPRRYSSPAPPIPRSTTEYQQPSTYPQRPQPTMIPMRPRSSAESNYVESIPEPGTCGIVDAVTNDRRIVGGVPAKLGQFPWAVLLGYRSRDPSKAQDFRCGGSLITRKHVLTAAHCILNHLFMVRVGELDWQDDNDGATPIDIPIRMKIPHEQYRQGDKLVNDIAVLVLDEEVQFTSLIRPICLPASEEQRKISFVGYTPFVIGWGATENTTASPKLLSVQLPVKDNQVCATKFVKNKSTLIDDRVLCVGLSGNSGKDSCSGDSGGPLLTTILDKATGRYPYYQIGVVSYGPKLCGTGLPGVYTKVTTFIPWILSKIVEPEYSN